MVAPLPQQTLLYSTGSPLLYHYRMIDGAAIDPVHRYCAPTAAKSMYICKDEELLARKTDFLHVFAECFPAEAQRYGQTFYIKSFIYDLFPGLEKRVDDTLLAIPVSFRTGESETVGYFIDSKAYLTLYEFLKDIHNTWGRVILEITGRPLLIPQWAINDRPCQVWSAGEFGMFAIKYREELETFLYLVHKHR